MIIVFPEHYSFFINLAKEEQKQIEATILRGPSETLHGHHTNHGALRAMKKYVARLEALKKQLEKDANGDGDKF